MTSVRSIPCDESSVNFTVPGMASSKLGQPVPESNLASEEKSSWPQTLQVNIPLSWLFTRSLENGASVPFSLRIWYSSAESCFFSSSSERFAELVILSLLIISMLLFFWFAFNYYCTFG